MKIFDTDLLVDYLRGQKRAVEAFEAHVAEAATTTLNAAELLAGALLSNRPDEALQRVDQILERITLVPFGKRAARAYAAAKRERQKKGLPGGVIDLLVASVAISEGATVVTKNVRDFEGLPGLVVETW